MEVRLRNLDDTTHEAAKVAAARGKKSLNTYVLEAVRAQVLRDGLRDPAVAIVLNEAAKKRKRASS